MKEIVAGWAAGYAMGIVATAALAYLSRQGGTLARLRERTFPGLSPVGFAVPVFVGVSLLWTLLGILLGAIYRGGDFVSQADFAGSPAGAYTIGVCLVALLPLPPLLILAPRDWVAWAASSVAAALLFGWGMPLLAGL